MVVSTTGISKTGKIVLGMGVERVEMFCYT
jgi:hypothetical protein